MTVTTLAGEHIPAYHQARILIVEDESIIGAHIRGTLLSLGHTVMASVTRGQAAVEAALQSSPDLILMDIGLPGPIDGIDAAIRIRSTQDIPIVFLTGNADQTTLERAREADPFGWVAKPFQEFDLGSTIQTALVKHRAELQLREHLRQIEELAASALHLLEIRTADEVFAYCSASLARMVGDAVILVSEDSADGTTAWMRSIRGIEPELSEQIRTTIGFSLLGHRFPVSEEILRGHREGKLLRLAGGLPALGQGALAPELLAHIEQVLGIVAVDSIGMVSRNQFLGSVHILHRRPVDASLARRIEAFVAQVTIALQGRRADQVLRNGISSLAAVFESVPAALVLFEIGAGREMTCASANRAFSRCFHRYRCGIVPPLTGESLEHLLVSVMELTEGDAREAVEASTLAFGGRRPVRREFPVLKGRIHSEITFFPVVHQDGTCTHLLLSCVQRDVDDEGARAGRPRAAIAGTMEPSVA
jgi:CheY-like chemotaxis protein